MQVCVDRLCGELAVLRDGYEERRREGGIATGKYAGDSGGERQGIDLECAGCGLCNLVGSQKLQVGGLTDGEYDGVRVKGAPLVVVELRLEAPRVIEDAR